MDKKIKLYAMDLSPPARAVLLTLKALNLPFEYHNIDLIKGEHLSKEFIAKNPVHTVPTLEDDGNLIWESHAIMTYLVGKYGKDDTLYPKDLLKRAIVDQRLHFETGMVFEKALRNISIFLLFKNEINIPKYKIDVVHETFGFMEKFLEKQNYMAADHLTLADLSLITTVTSLQAFVEINAENYPKLFAWMKRMEALPYYEEANGVGAKKLVEVIKSKNFTIV